MYHSSVWYNYPQAPTMMKWVPRTGCPVGGLAANSKPTPAKYAITGAAPTVKLQYLHYYRSVHVSSGRLRYIIFPKDPFLAPQHVLVAAAFQQPFRVLVALSQRSHATAATMRLCRG